LFLQINDDDDDDEISDIWHTLHALVSRSD